VTSTSTSTFAARAQACRGSMMMEFLGIHALHRWSTDLLWCCDSKLHHYKLTPREECPYWYGEILEGDDA